MADEPTNPTDSPAQAPTTPTEQPAATSAPPPVVDVRALPEFKEEIERVFTERLGREREKIRKQLLSETRAPTPAAPAEPQVKETAPAQPAPGDVQREIAELKQRSEFREAVAEYGFSREQRKYFENLYVSAGGGDPFDWLSDFARAAGLGTTKQGAQPSPQPTPQAPQPVTPQSPPGPPASDRGGVTAANNTFATSDPERWTEDTVNRLRAEAAEAGVSAGHYVKNKFLAGLRGKTIVFSR